jgi:hypothetical protein
MCVHVFKGVHVCVLSGDFTLFDHNIFQVRAIAKENGLVTATRPDSMVKPLTHLFPRASITSFLFTKSFPS